MSANSMQQTVEDFCKRICELDASSGFISFLFELKQEVMLSAPQHKWLQYLFVPKRPKRAALSIIGARFGEVLKGPECVIIAERQGTVQGSVG